MKTKIISFIFLMAFLLTAVHCKPPALPSPPRPMTPTERIFGVFQASTGDIISLNDVGFYMIEAITDRNYSGLYSINELGLLELSRTNGIVRFQLERGSSSRIVSRLIGLDGTPFERILSEEQYNNYLFDRLAAQYTGIGPNGQNYSLNLNLASYRIAEFTRSDVPGRIFGGYYIDDVGVNVDDYIDIDGNDDDVIVISNQGSMIFSIQRNSLREIDNLIYGEEGIQLVREGIHVNLENERNVYGTYQSEDRRFHFDGLPSRLPLYLELLNTLYGRYQSHSVNSIILDIRPEVIYITRNGRRESANYIVYFRDTEAYHCTIQFEFDGQTHIYYLFLEREDPNTNFRFTGIFNDSIRLNRMEDSMTGDESPL